MEMDESTNRTILSGSSPTRFMGISLAAAIVFTFIPCFVIYCIFCQSKKSSQEEDRGKDETYQLHFKHVTMTLASLFVFTLDFVTDIVITWSYWTDGNYENFCLTIIFTILPIVPNSVTMMIGIFHPDMGLDFKFIFMILIVPIPLIIQFIALSASLAIGPDFNQQTFLKNVAWLAPLLGMIEATFESAPQIIVQIYIYLKSTMDEKSNTRYIWYIAVAASVLGVAKSIYIFKHNVIRWNGKEVNLKGKMFSYVSSIAVIVPRVLLLATFVYVAPIIPFAIFFVIHFIICTVIAFCAGCKNTRTIGERETSKFEIASGIAVFLLRSFANVFFFCEYEQNVEEGLRKKIRIAFYVSFYIENLVLAIYALTNDQCIIPTIGIAGFVLHIILYAIYKDLKNRNDTDENNGYEEIQNSGYHGVQNNGHGAVQNDGSDGFQNNRGDGERLLALSSIQE